MNKDTRTLELLAPARDYATAVAAINHGADAVYMGATAFGARAAAGNSVEDIRRVVEYARAFGVKVYVTVNTIVYETELDDVKNLISDLWRIGVDALIVQDTALLEMDLPPIELHASTQTDARTPEKVKWLAQAGFSQIVVPREFSLEEIRRAAEAAGQEGSRIEVFVHGALCVSYSGDCHAGALLAGRSANRGECPQVCRLRFTLTDEKGSPVRIPDGKGPSRHWLSLADMNRVDELDALARAGASSFKIEGRLKNESYVKNVVAAYSQALDKVVEASQGKFRRSSYGRTVYNFEPALNKSFNRGFTGYFLTGKNADTVQIHSWNSPKWIGLPVAKVQKCDGKILTVGLMPCVELNNGDGLGYFDAKGQFDGVRVNRVDGNRIFHASDKRVNLAPGSILYRNSDISREAVMSRNDTALRTISVDAVLRRLPDGRIAVDMADERGARITVTSKGAFEDMARTPQKEARLSVMQKLGSTVYRLNTLDDRLGDLFIPSKELTALRRSATEALDSAWNMRRPILLRKKPTLAKDALKGLVLDYHANVANSLAEHFYESHGARVLQKAVETSMPRGEQRVMTTRYCLRRSLGCCLKTPKGKDLPQKMWLDAPMGRLRLEFDCANCKMKIYTNPNPKYSTNGKD